MQGEADANLHPGAAGAQTRPGPQPALPGGSGPGQGSRETQGGRVSPVSAPTRRSVQVATLPAYCASSLPSPLRHLPFRI